MMEELYGIVLTKGCLVEYWQPQCPGDISQVYFTLEEGEDATLYTPALASWTPSFSGEGLVALPATAQLASHGPGSACGVKADYPYRQYLMSTDNWIARGSSTNHCLYGQNITFQEMWSTLYDRRSDGTWRALNTDYAKKAGAGYIYNNITYNCQHTAERRYQNEAAACSTQGSRTYCGLNRKYATFTCPG
jgi:hypothetical protein